MAERIVGEAIKIDWNVGVAGGEHHATVVVAVKQSQEASVVGNARVDADRAARRERFKSAS